MSHVRFASVVAIGLCGMQHAVAAGGGGPYLGGPTSPPAPVVFTVPSSGGPKAPNVSVTIPSATVDGLIPQGGGTPAPGASVGPGRTSEGGPATYTTVIKGPASGGDGTLRRSFAPIEPSNELPKPTQCLAQGEYEKSGERANAVWNRMVEAAESRSREATPAPRRLVVGDRGASRSSDLGLDSPIRGPARDVFATPSHVVTVPAPESVPDASRDYFSGR